MGGFKRRLGILISLPFLALMIVFDIGKLPLTLALILVIGFFDIIMVLRGEESSFIGASLMVLFLGILIWMAIVGIEEPKWLHR